jgi:hypothetical protein
MGTSVRHANSTRRIRPRPIRVSSVVRRRRAAPKVPDFSQIMGHLADAIAYIRVSHRSLDHLEVAFEEVSLLRMGLAALDAVYTEIDMASIALSKQLPS